uniref:Retrovirus-related Pol polyprotein from transposon TNT 1-94 n=1 Tax=Cajanus cajan TaxID=3821 RepID=A0A151TQC5_CAJCA|nr:hypothetical protein KK1_008431 [Cajanus cajan]
MTGDPSKFLSLKLKNEGFVTYGDNNKGKILGHGNIGNSSSSALIENVLLVDGLVMVDDYSRFTWVMFLAN